MKSNNKGFTLIELLVVVAIIGILSSIVLASLNTARNKGQDASAKGSLSSARASAELYFDEYGDYGDSVSVTFVPDTLVPGDTLDSANDICGYNSITSLAVAAASQVDSDVDCDTTIAPAGYTMWTTMNDDREYCVDSTGYAGYIPTGGPVLVGESCR
jgi:prepilin-type N-terminal cleavage/methylation domain-containing protein